MKQPTKHLKHVDIRIKNQKLYYGMSIGDDHEFYDEFIKKLRMPATTNQIWFAKLPSQLGSRLINRFTVVVTCQAVTVIASHVTFKYYPHKYIYGDIR